MSRTIGDLAKIVTSKNAGPYRLTVDVFFNDRAQYEGVRNSQAITAERVALAYGLRLEQVRLIRFSDAALGVKITMEQSVAADDFRSSDTYGAQHHMPIAELTIPE